MKTPTQFLPFLADIDSDQAAGIIGIIFGLFMFLVWLLVLAVIVAALWKVFTKAGKPGWAAIIPVYNTMILAEIVGKPAWWGLLPYIPFVGIIFAIMLMIGLAQSFGKSTGFAVGLILVPFVFLPILAFGDSRYLGAPAATLNPPLPA